MNTGNNKLYNGEICCYQDVVDAQDEELLQVCERAVTILKRNNWKSMGYENRMILYPRADFKIKSKLFSNCEVYVLNDEGTILTRVVGKISPKSLYNDFCIDLTTHSDVSEGFLRERYSAEAYLAEKYSKELRL